MILTSKSPHSHTPSLKSHKFLRSSTRETHECPICGQQFADRTGPYRHAKKAHGVSLAKKVKGKPSLPISDTSVSRKKTAKKAVHNGLVFVHCAQSTSHESEPAPIHSDPGLNTTIDPLHLATIEGLLSFMDPLMTTLESLRLLRGIPAILIPLSGIHQLSDTETMHFVLELVQWARVPTSSHLVTAILSGTIAFDHALQEQMIAVMDALARRVSSAFTGPKYLAPGEAEWMVSFFLESVEISKQQREQNQAIPETLDTVSAAACIEAKLKATTRSNTPSSASSTPRSASSNSAPIPFTPEDIAVLLEMQQTIDFNSFELPLLDDETLQLLAQPPAPGPTPTFDLDHLSNFSLPSFQPC